MEQEKLITSPDDTKNIEINLKVAKLSSFLKLTKKLWYSGRDTNKSSRVAEE